MFTSGQRERQPERRACSQQNHKPNMKRSRHEAREESARTTLYTFPGTHRSTSQLVFFSTSPVRSHLTTRKGGPDRHSEYTLTRHKIAAGCCSGGGGGCRYPLPARAPPGRTRPHHGVGRQVVCRWENENGYECTRIGSTKLLVTSWNDTRYT